MSTAPGAVPGAANGAAENRPVRAAAAEPCHGDLVPRASSAELARERQRRTAAGDIGFPASTVSCKLAERESVTTLRRADSAPAGQNHGVATLR